jgi:hypothetical protein
MSDELGFGKDAVQAFVTLPVWKRIVEDALTRGLLLSEDNDILDPLENTVIIARNQGQISVLKWIVGLPAIYVDEIGEVKQTKQEEGD